MKDADITYKIILAMDLETWSGACNAGYGPVLRAPKEYGKLVLVHPDETNGPCPFCNIFDPVNRWDHIGIVIEWMEKKGKRLSIISYTDNRDIFWDEENDTFCVTYPVEEPLTPRHIALATIGALEES